jgi:hypothetical protein
MSATICVIVGSNLKFAPYVNLYTDYLDENQIKYDIVTWNKSNIHEDVQYSYSGKKNDGNYILSFFQYFGFGHFLNKILMKNEYRQLIVFGSATLFFIKRSIIKKYHKNFILDIRDDTPIRKYFKKRFLRLAQSAAFVVTSSKMYESWIGRTAIMSHNINKKMFLSNTNYFPRRKQVLSPLRIINAGMMIEPQANIQLIDILKNRIDYSFIYYGPDVPGMIALKEYCKSNSISNVSFKGTYDKKDIISIYRENGDLVNIIRSNTVVNRDALPNKFYESVLAGVPLVVYEHNTAIANYVKEFYLGIVLQSTNEIHSIKNLYSSFDWNKYSQGRIVFLESILKDIGVFEKSLGSFVCNH